MHTPDIVHICPHLFTDDTQVYGRCSHSEMCYLAARVSSCMDDILELNAIQLTPAQYTPCRLSFCMVFNEQIPTTEIMHQA